MGRAGHVCILPAPASLALVESEVERVREVTRPTARPATAADRPRPPAITVERGAAFQQLRLF
jgi:hypothetical protein